MQATIRARSRKTLPTPKKFLANKENVRPNRHADRLAPGKGINPGDYPPPSYFFPAHKKLWKECSPDNSACEGFFGRIKNEMFFGRALLCVTMESFMETLDRYLQWYNTTGIKMSLGGMSPLKYRKSLIKVL